MNRKLTEADIRATWDALTRRQGRATGRQVRAALRTQFGVAGSTSRVFALCRQWNAEAAEARSSEPALHARIRELEAELAKAQAAKAAALERALLAEEREIRHQDHWANEIHELRQVVAKLSSKPFPT